GGYDVIQLINLYRQTTNLWQDSSASTPTPPTFHNVQVKYYVGHGIVQGVYAASPDFQYGAATKLKYTYSESEGKRYISFTVPSLQYWDMIYVKKTT
ncbi:MAG: glycoside hydrolase family 66 protein, partial [Bacilli bacterium]